MENISQRNPYLCYMKQVVVNIPDDKFKFFMELIKSLNFVKIADKKESQFVDELKGALHEADLHEQGKVKLGTLDELLDEL